MAGPRLSLARLAALPAEVARPAYDPAATRIGMVHLGIGAFHRAHQAVYADERLAQEPDWAILGASLRSADTAEALNPQEGLYSLAVAGPEGTRHRVIGSVRGVLVAAHDPGTLLARMSDPAVRIVSLTVTEKGYCRAASGELDEAHADIRSDLASPGAPASALGYLVEALRRRRAAGTAPFTVLTCDNLPANGRTLAGLVARLAALRDPDLGRFVANDVAFPSTMVDRIVPATTDADREAAEATLVCADAWPVAAEPFSQWVIEDRFPAGRPDLAAAGVQMTGDVEPFERAKLRMLNGSHSTLAYLGFLAGHAHVADAIGDPPFRRLIHDLMSEEVAPTLRPAPGLDLPAYRDALLTRFANPGLKHRTAQIAMDGTQKLPQRLLGTIRDRRKVGAPFGRLALAVAGWMRYATGIDENGHPYEVSDPLAGRLKQVVTGRERDARALVRALLGMEAVFGNDLPADPAFVAQVTHFVHELLVSGARATVAGFDPHSLDGRNGGT